MDSSEHRQCVWTGASVRLLFVGNSHTGEWCSEEAGSQVLRAKKCFVSSEAPNSYNRSMRGCDYLCFIDEETKDE